MSTRIAKLTGDPLFPAGPPVWPIADDDVREALEQAYVDGSWGKYHGGNCDRLREELAVYHHVQFVRLCCTGTAAVELALRAVGVNPGDEVILAAYDFAGNFRAIERVGARPVLLDIDASTWTMDVEQLSDARSHTTKAMIVSHLHGGLADVPHIVQWAQAHGVSVVEDACQAHGATIGGRRVGSLGDVGVLSFGGSKLMTSGRGGAILTASETIFQRTTIYAEQGNDAYAMSELQAAVLRPQLRKLDERNKIRADHAHRLRQLASPLPGVASLRVANQHEFPSYYKLPWLLNIDPAVVHDRETIIRAAQAAGIALDVGFSGFAARSSRRCRKPVPLGVSERAAANTVVLHHPVLLQPLPVIERVAAAIREIILVSVAGELEPDAGNAMR
jgi:dTDP-4-amino-4,6-dideoxygalactose transaminase